MAPASDDLSDVALTVLAGGEGSRMGRPKIELLLDGKPILHALLDRIAWPGPTILSVAGRQDSFPGFERFSRVIHDKRSGQGPLRGLWGVLKDSYCDSPALCTAVVAIPVDMPLLRRKQLAWLASQLKARPQARGLMIVRTTADGTTRVEPFPSAFRTNFAPIAELRLRQKNRALHGLAAEPTVETISPPAYWPEETWTNLNTPHDLAAYEERRPGAGG